MAQVDFLLAETDQFWARDCGPMFTIDSKGSPAILDWGYNGYARMDKLGPDVPETLKARNTILSPSLVVLVPVYEDVMDAEAIRILGEIYPDKEIIPIYLTALTQFS